MSSDYTLDPRLSRQRIFILAVCVFCCIGSGLGYTFSVLQPYIADYFQAEASQTVLLFTLWMVGGIGGSLTGGILQKHLPTKVCLAIGYAMTILGYFSMSLLPPTMFYVTILTYSVLMAMGNGILYNVLIAVLTKWFPDRKGTATGLALGMIGGGYGKRIRSGQ